MTHYPACPDVSRPVKRILVIGCGGSGKSTFSLRMGETLGIPVFHLDRLFWHPGWVPSTDEAFEQKLSEVLAGDKWIMDGNYSRTLDMRIRDADTIIFLDMPTLTCLSGAFSRWLKYWGRSRPDMTEGNNERINLEFLGWILSYRRTRRPKVMATLERFKDSKEVIILKKRSEMAGFLSRLATGQQPAAGRRT